MLIVWIHKSWVRRLDWFLWQEGIKKVRTYAAIVETSQEEASIVPTFRSAQYSTTILKLSGCSLFSNALEKCWHTECRSSWRASEIIFIVFLSPIFPHKWRHSPVAAYLWWIKERAIYRIPYSWSSITYRGPTLILGNTSRCVIPLFISNKVHKSSYSLVVHVVMRIPTHKGCTG